MIIKIDAETKERLTLLQKTVQGQTGMAPQSVSLMVQVLIQWALAHVKGPVLEDLAPRMLTLAQQRRAVAGEVLAVKRDLNPSQMREMMKMLKKLKQSTSIKEELGPTSAA